MRTIISILYISIVAVLGIATIFGEYEGLDYAKEEIYHAWWLILLWAALAIAGITYIVRIRMKDIATLTLHCSLVLILLGALITHVWGVQGSIHLRKGSYAVFFDAEGIQQQLPFAIRLNNFSVQLYTDNGNVSDYKSEITLADMDHNILKRGEVSMNNILNYRGWRFYQWSYDDDGMGATLAVNCDPTGIAVTYAGYLLLFVSISVTAVAKCRGIRRRRRLSGRLTRFEKGMTWTACILPALTAAAGIYFFVTQICGTNPWISEMQPILNSPWLSLHVSVIMIAYILLLLTFVSSVAALCGGDGHNLRLLSLQLLHPAMAMLAIGIFVGAIWANVSWGTYWGWDPKEVWALITMMVYAIALHSRSLTWLRRPTAYHLFMALSFLTILMTFLGVNFLLSGMHSYI